jgi:hypothetical protein
MLRALLSLLLATTQEYDALSRFEIVPDPSINTVITGFMTVQP